MGAFSFSFPFFFGGPPVDGVTTSAPVAGPGGLTDTRVGDAASGGGFGADVSTFPDLDPSLTLVSGQKVVAEAVARRLMTPRGSLFYDQAYGTDLRGYLNDAITSDRLAAVKADIEGEAILDERVKAVNATVTFDAATNAIKASVLVETDDGPFTMSLAITAVNVSLLSTSV